MTPLPNTTAFARTPGGLHRRPGPFLLLPLLLCLPGPSGSRTCQEAFSPAAFAPSAPWVPFVLRITPSRLPSKPFLAAQPKQGLRPDPSPHSPVALAVPVSESMLEHLLLSLPTWLPSFAPCPPAPRTVPGGAGGIQSSGWMQRGDQPAVSKLPHPSNAHTD